MKLAMYPNLRHFIPSKFDVKSAEVLASSVIFLLEFIL